MEQMPGSWRWKQLTVSDDGKAVVALTSEEGDPRLWLWSSQHTPLPESSTGHSQVSIEVTPPILFADSGKCGAVKTTRMNTALLGLQRSLAEFFEKSKSARHKHTKK